MSLSGSSFHTRLSTAPDLVKETAGGRRWEHCLWTEMGRAVSSRQFAWWTRSLPVGYREI